MSARRSAAWGLGGTGTIARSLLDERFLAQIREMPTKNLAAELLERLLSDQIRSRGKKNALQGKEFATRLEDAINRYQNRGLTTVEVIEELIRLAREINEACPLPSLGRE